MDRLGVAGLRGGDDPIAEKVALARRGRADMQRLVGLADMAGTGVGVRIDRNRADAERPRGADDPAGDLAAIGDEERSDHG